MVHKSTQLTLLKNSVSYMYIYIYIYIYRERERERERLELFVCTSYCLGRQ